jgi:hypothetical protein
MIVFVPHGEQVSLAHLPSPAGVESKKAGFSKLNTPEKSNFCSGQIHVAVSDAPRGLLNPRLGPGFGNPGRAMYCNILLTITKLSPNLREGE